MQSDHIPTRPTPSKNLASFSANPFRLTATQRRLLQRVKRALVALGGSGRRSDFEFVKKVFAKISELKSV